MEVIGSCPRLGCGACHLWELPKHVHSPQTVALSQRLQTKPVEQDEQHRVALLALRVGIINRMMGIKNRLESRPRTICCDGRDLQSIDEPFALL
jgi:hypothetical protein